MRMHYCPVNLVLIWRKPNSYAGLRMKKLGINLNFMAAFTHTVPRRLSDTAVQNPRL